MQYLFSSDIEEVMKSRRLHDDVGNVVHDPKQHRRVSNAERRVEMEAKRLCEDGSNDGDSKATKGDDVASSGGSGLLSRAALSGRGGWAARASDASGTSAGSDGRGSVDTRNDGSGGSNWNRGNSSGSRWDSWGRGDCWNLRGSRDDWSRWSHGNRSSGRRSLDLAVADLRDDLNGGRGDLGLRSSGNEAGEEGNGGSGETHLDCGWWLKFCC